MIVPYGGRKTSTKLHFSVLSGHWDEFGINKNVYMDHWWGDIDLNLLV